MLRFPGVPISMVPEALIFDCDGTLVLSADLHFAAFSAALAAQGAHLDRAWYEARTGFARRDLIAAFCAQSGLRLDRARLEAESITATLARAATTVRANAPVAALARRCFGHLPMAVASNAEKPVVQAMLAAAALGDLFDPVVTLSEAGKAKPDPAMFLMAASAMAHAPARCLVLEDSDQGLQAARAAGIPALDVRLPSVLTMLPQLWPGIVAS
ncbi:MAG: HAD family phosphatase [Phaeovulum sp.]|nr:HAD family phosphatase [Phaeovulum sp.]